MKNFRFSVGGPTCDKRQNGSTFFVETYEKTKLKKLTVYSNLTFLLNYIILFISIYISACQNSGGYRKKKGHDFS